MDYSILGQMLFIAIVFFWGGWQFRASKMEKRVIAINERFESIINDIQSNIYQELEFSRIERDGVMCQQEEVMKSLEAYNKQYIELKKQEKKNIESKRERLQMKQNQSLTL